jgi:triosephosphate isomerase
MRRSLVAGNWKMNGSRSQAQNLVGQILDQSSLLKAVDIVICPPSVLISQVIRQLEGTEIGVGGQNLGLHAEGPYTGEISGPMLQDQGCRFVIVGHSERRHLFGESDSVVAKKTAFAYSCGLRPIVCVGETLQERENGETFKVVERQLRAVLEATGINIFPEGIVAYEPVWAIGTGQTAAPHQAQEVHVFIRRLLEKQQVDVGTETRILYGGSVNNDNAGDLFTEEDIDGGLIGGASLKATDFLSICRAVTQSC